MTTEARWPNPRRWLAAQLVRLFEAADDADYREHKRLLFADLTGTVAEIGPGTGANLPYLPAGVRWIGIEPNPFMQRHLREKATQLGLPVELRTGSAEQIPLPDSSVDTVIGTLVLCSVADQAATLREVRRVLAPGGRYYFIEHVAAPRGTWLRRLQRLTCPLWTCCLDGCHTDRETWSTIARAGFARLDLAHFRTNRGPTGPHIAGVARR